MFLFPVFSYAEIHYKFPFLKPKYFKKEPEILFDCPIRCLYEREKNIPIALIIKDAQLFPISLIKVSISIKSKKETIHFSFEESIHVLSRFYYKIFNIPIPVTMLNQFITITPKLEYLIDKTKKSVCIDNYYKLKKEPFTCFVSSESRPIPTDYFCGEPHYHSNYTDDQVEFGAPIEIAQRFAYTMGLDWFFVTDHSYDLDDMENNYLEYDPEHKKWKRLSDEISYFSNKDCCILRAEEASIGNLKNENIHLLCINSEEFIKGNGDSAEKWGMNKPCFSIKEVKRQQSENRLFIAAHPFDDIPYLQKLTLNRGSWSKEDFDAGSIEFIQAINNASLLEIERNKKKWVNLLLMGFKYYLIAGNDAHGNFQFMKQIKIPFLELFSTKKQIFGRFFTIFKYSENDPIQGFKHKHLSISNGPFLDFIATSQLHSYSIGQTIYEDKASINFESKTSKEFGEISNILLIIGDLIKKEEKIIKNPLQFSNYLLPCKGYLRMELKTKNIGIVITNPIWIERNDF